MYDIKNLNHQQLDYFKDKYGFSHVKVLGDVLILDYRNHLLGINLYGYESEYSGPIEDIGTFIDIVRANTINSCIRQLVNQVNAQDLMNKYSPRDN